MVNNARPHGFKRRPFELSKQVKVASFPLNPTLVPFSTLVPTIVERSLRLLWPAKQKTCNPKKDKSKRESQET